MIAELDSKQGFLFCIVSVAALWFLGMGEHISLYPHNFGVCILCCDSFKKFPKVSLSLLFFNFYILYQLVLRPNRFQDHFCVVHGLTYIFYIIYIEALCSKWFCFPLHLTPVVL